MSDMYVYMQDYGGWGCAPPRIFLEIRCSEIASEVTLGQKQSHSIVIYTWFVQYCIQFLAVQVCIC